MKRRAKKIKAAVDRDTVYDFAWKAIEAGHPEPAVAAVNALNGYSALKMFWLVASHGLTIAAKWHRLRSRSCTIRPGAIVWHPLEERTPDGLVRFYEDAESVLKRLPRRGVPLILKARRAGGVDAYRPNHMAKLVRTLADQLGLPGTFTLDACRHGGMTELEEAELTTGQGRALSGHRTDSAYSGYAKVTMKRALAATRKRHAHRLANENGTSIQKEGQTAVQNETRSDDKAIA